MLLAIAKLLIFSYAQKSNAKGRIDRAGSRPVSRASPALHDFEFAESVAAYDRARTVSHLHRGRMPPLRRIHRTLPRRAAVCGGRAVPRLRGVDGGRGRALSRAHRPLRPTARSPMTSKIRRLRPSAPRNSVFSRRWKVNWRAELEMRTDQIPCVIE